MNVGILLSVVELLFSFDPAEGWYSCHNLALERTGRETTVVQRENCGWMFPSVYPPRNPLDNVREFRLRSRAPAGTGARVTLELMRKGRTGTAKITCPWTDETVFPLERSSNSGLSVHALIFHLPAGVTRGEYGLGSLTCVRETSPADDVRFDVSTGSPLHLLSADQSVAQAVFTNAGEETREIRVRMEIRGWNGGESEVGDFTATLPPTGSKRIDFAVPDGYGPGLARAEIASGTSSVVRTVLFARVPKHGVTPPLPKGKFRIGVNYHMRRYAPRDRELTLRALDASGAKIVRGFGASMLQTCPASGVCDWAETDHCLDSLQEHGLAVSLNVWDTPRWLADERHRTNAEWRVWARSLPPEKPFSDYLRSLARRYRGRIAYYEIGNEWDLIPARALSIDEGISAHRIAYRALKAGDPDAVIETNGWAFPDSSSEKVVQKGFQERILSEARDSYDVHGIHLHGPYAQYRRDLAAFLAIRKGLKVEAPWFDNECAQPTMYGNDQQVADCVWKKVLFAWSKGSLDYVWYNLRATGYDPDDWEQGYGLMTPDYQPRASFAAFAALTSVFSGLNFKRVVDDGEHRSVLVFASDGDGGTEPSVVVAGWDDDGETTWSIATDAKSAERIDLFGNSLPIGIASGRLAWRPSGRPGCVVLHGATRAEVGTDDMKGLE